MLDELNKARQEYNQELRARIAAESQQKIGQKGEDMVRSPFKYVCTGQELSFCRLLSALYGYTNESMACTYSHNLSVMADPDVLSSESVETAFSYSWRSPTSIITTWFAFNVSHLF